MKTFLLLFLSAAYLLIAEGARVKIIDGREAVPHCRPYMALIKFETETEEKICGGSLIKPNWVLTAAHCQMHRSRVTITLGAHSREGNDKERQYFRVARSIQHPHYNRTTIKNDIRLIKLNRRAKLGRAVHLLPLPESFEDIEAGTVCETAGWGRTEKGQDADFLMEVNVTVLEREKCHRHWNNKVNITKDMMCTNVGPGGQDTCEGDSGGPLICKHVFRGVTSFGETKCGHPNDASVFTRLTKEYLEWIISTISD